MPGDFKYDVFLSHNHRDKPKVRQLAEALHAEGVDIWFDEQIIKPGDHISLEVGKGLKASRKLLLCMSPAAFGSDWVSMEQHTILFGDPTNQKRRFIPLLLEDCEIPDILRPFMYIDARTLDASTIAIVRDACLANGASDTVLTRVEKARRGDLEAKVDFLVRNQAPTDETMDRMIKQQRPQGQQKLTFALVVIIVACIIGLVLPALWRQEPMPMFLRLFGVFVFSLVLIPFYQYLNDQDTNRSMEGLQKGMQRYPAIEQQALGHLYEILRNR